MQRIPLKTATPGMILAREVQTPDGKILCGPGVELTAELLDRLSRVGIASVTVKGHPVALPGEKDLPERLRELETRFAPVADDPVLKALMRLIAEHWVDEEQGQQPQAPES